MDENVLRNLKRKQTNKQVIKAVNLIKKYKFDILDVDIIA
jgi:coproporphyrinogen III oxidase-like Fe-S oxidoreductase